MDATESGEAATTDLWDLADRVRRLAPDRHDPERFHADKDAVVDDLRRLARRLEGRP